MEALQFIDCNSALAIDDGNSFVGTSNQFTEVNDGIGKEAKTIEQGGIPRLRTYLAGENPYTFYGYAPNPSTNIPVMLGGDSFLPSRGLIVQTKDVQDFININEYACFFPVDVVDGVNNASIVGGVVSQRSSFDDICLDRLSRAFEYPFAIGERYNQTYDFANYSFLYNKSYIFVFIDHVTGKPVRNPASRWTQMQNVPAGYENDTRDSIGFFISIILSPMRSGSVSGAQSRILHIEEGLFLEDGTFLMFQRIIARYGYGTDGTSINETTADSYLEAFIRSNKIEYYFRSNFDDGLLRYPKTQRYTSFIQDDFRNPTSPYKLFKGYMLSRNNMAMPDTFAIPIRTFHL